MGKQSTTVHLIRKGPWDGEQDQLILGGTKVIELDDDMPLALVLSEKFEAELAELKQLVACDPRKLPFSMLW